MEEIDHFYTRCKHFFISNSLMRNLYWDSQMAKKLSVLKPQKLRNLEDFPQHNGFPRARRRILSVGGCSDDFCGY